MKKGERVLTPHSGNCARMEAIRYCSAADASAGAVGVALAWDSTIADAADGLRVELIEATPPKLAQTLADTRRVASKKKMVSVGSLMCNTPIFIPQIQSGGFTSKKKKMGTWNRFRENCKTRADMSIPCWSSMLQLLLSQLSTVPRNIAFLQ